MIILYELTNKILQKDDFFIYLFIYSYSLQDPVDIQRHPKLVFDSESFALTNRLENEWKYYNCKCKCTTHLLSAP